jgi:hypothetical protein
MVRCLRRGWNYSVQAEYEVTIPQVRAIANACGETGTLRTDFNSSSSDSAELPKALAMNSRVRQMAQ